MYFYKNTEQAVRLGSWKAYRKSPKHDIELYLIEEDIHSERDLAECYPEVVRQIDSIMKSEHENHSWYRNPWETPDDYKLKVKKARESGTMQISVRPNGL
jgi:hypothetical protein